MKKILSLLLAVVLCFSLVCCDTSNNEKDARKSSTKAKSSSSTKKESSSSKESEGSTPILYKVTNNGTTVYLFGSIHIATDDMYPLPDYVIDAFDESDALAVECDVTDVDTSSLVEVLQNMLYRDGTTIADHISEDLYEEGVEILKEHKLYSSYLDYYYPVMWYSFISSAMTEKFGYDSEKGIDAHLINAADEDGKEIIEIESAEFQYNTLASFSEELGLSLLEGVIETYNSKLGKMQFNMLVDAWTTGNEEKLIGLLSDEDSGISKDEEKLMEEYNKKLIVDRNISMTDFVENALKNGDEIFVCVGAAHIVGEEAMVDLLRQRGYTVERVK